MSLRGLLSQTGHGSVSCLSFLCPRLVFPGALCFIPLRSSQSHPQFAWVGTLWVSDPPGFTSLPFPAWDQLPIVSAIFSSTTPHLLSLCTYQAISQFWKHTTIHFLRWGLARENSQPGWLLRQQLVVLQIAEKKREVKGKGEKERYTHLNAEFQRIARRDTKAFLWTMQRNRGNQ